MTAPGTVFVFGGINLDMVVGVAELPREGQTVLGGELAQYPGGKGGNQALAAARAGAPAQMVASIGPDTYAELALRYLKEAGVGLGLIRRHETLATGVAMIAVDRVGHNQIVVAPGANGLVVADQLDSQISDTSVLLAQLEVPAREVYRAMVLAKRAGARTILNASPAELVSEELLRTVDFLIVNDEEGAAIGEIVFGNAMAGSDAMRRVVEAFGCVALLTRGESGVDVYAPGESFHVPAYRVQAVDTVGAGDAFAGALAAGIAAKLPLREAVQRANVAAGLKCKHPGAQPGLPTRQQIDAALANAEAVQ